MFAVLWIRRCRPPRSSRPAFLADHLFQAFEVWNERRLVEHADLAQDRATFGEAAARVGLHNVVIDAHELWEALRDDAEIAAGHLAGQRNENHDTRARARRWHSVTARRFERNHRHLPAAPGNCAEIPRRYAFDSLGRLPR